MSPAPTDGLPVRKPATTEPECDRFSIAGRDPVREAVVPRLFIREPGWIVRLKVGSQKLYCFTVAPGDEVYHRISDGEIFLERADERICLPCADRHGLLQHEPKPLRPGVRGAAVATPSEPDEGYAVREDGEGLGS